eukprot:TRINITY_DN947_c0_g1_i6.p2 TRINITY_DN947_c0_g1~~TRINITY_DN947_c0_g1_i6.p2  ORF type:complete len:205 (+),score=34.61 TRINITY_DN947_c0_g1_i6:1439-2053(+)
MPRRRSAPSTHDVHVADAPPPVVRARRSGARADRERGIRRQRRGEGGGVVGAASTAGTTAAAAASATAPTPASREAESPRASAKRVVAAAATDWPFVAAASATSAGSMALGGETSWTSTTLPWSGVTGEFAASVAAAAVVPVTGRPPPNQGNRERKERGKSVDRVGGDRTPTPPPRLPDAGAAARRGLLRTRRRRLGSRTPCCC